MEGIDNLALHSSPFHSRSEQPLLPEERSPGCNARARYGSCHLLTVPISHDWHVEGLQDCESRPTLQFDRPLCLIQVRHPICPPSVEDEMFRAISKVSRKPQPLVVPHQFFGPALHCVVKRRVGIQPVLEVMAADEEGVKVVEVALIDNRSLDDPSVPAHHPVVLLSPSRRMHRTPSRTPSMAHSTGRAAAARWPKQQQLG